MAHKMGYRMRVPSKSAARELFNAKVNKKRLPTIPPMKNHKNPEYAKMSIDEYEKKYG